MSFDDDLVFLKTALGDLQDYILSKEMYWTLRSPSHARDGAQLPQLTLGNILMSEARLAALTLSEDQASDLEAIARQVHRVREEWKTNWGLKAGKEFTQRLSRWLKYLEELRADPKGSAPFYPREVRNRALLRLLRPEILKGIPAQEDAQLASADQALKAITQPGPFVWEPEVSQSFPQDGFWFLYRVVKE